MTNSFILFFARCFTAALQLQLVASTVAPLPRTKRQILEQLEHVTFSLSGASMPLPSSHWSHSHVATHYFLSVCHTQSYMATQNLTQKNRSHIKSAAWRGYLRGYMKRILLLVIPVWTWCSVNSDLMSTSRRAIVALKFVDLFVLHVFWTRVCTFNLPVKNVSSLVLLKNLRHSDDRQSQLKQSHQ